MGGTRCIQHTANTFPQLHDLVELVQQTDVETAVPEDTVASEELTAG